MANVSIPDINKEYEVYDVYPYVDLSRRFTGNPTLRIVVPIRHTPIFQKKRKFSLVSGKNTMSGEVVHITGQGEGEMLISVKVRSKR